MKDAKLVIKIILLIGSIFAFYYMDFRGKGLTFYWFLGFLLSLIYNNETVNGLLKSLSSKVLWIIVVFLALGVLFKAYFNRPFYDVSIAILVSAIILFGFHLKSSLFETKLFAEISKFIASYSYSLYLIHYSVIVYLIAMPFNLNFWGIPIFFIVANLVSFLFYLLFERRFYLFKSFIKKKYVG